MDKDTHSDIAADIKQYEKDTGNKFQSAFRWDANYNRHHHTVTRSDLHLQPKT